MAHRGTFVVKVEVEWPASGATMQDGVELGVAAEVG
jgi:hypothetical protein